MIILVSALVSLVLVGVFIQLAPRYGLGKAVRADGPETPQSKAGTPTMGGAAFLVAALLTWLFFGRPGVDSVAVALLTLAVAGLGLFDDIIALRNKRLVEAAKEANETPKLDPTTGLLARYRIVLQAVAAAPFALYAVRNGQDLLGPGFVDFFGFIFVIVGTINALNFSDGLDGLAGGIAALILLPFVGVSFVGALVGALLGFLWFNAFPARVFMGGVGSEALGAAVAGTAILAGWVWWLPLIALVPLAEVVSVIIQVVYFRLSGGKRFFKMAPLHHHFEKLGMPETQVTMRFWLVTAVCVGLAWGLAGGLR